jgi:Flp pilus assembly protein TadB
MFLLLFFLRPEYEAVMIYEEFGRKLLLAGAVSMLAGLYIMNKLIKAIEA